MIKTLQEKEALEDCLEKLKNSIFMKRGNLKQNLKTLPPPYSKILMDKLGNQQTENNLTAVKDTIEALENELEDMQEINLTLSFSPSQVFLNTIYSWIKKNMGKNLFINLSIDPNILGGAIIAYKGYYVNNSLERQLKNTPITRILRDVL